MYGYEERARKRTEWVKNGWREMGRQAGKKTARCEAPDGKMRRKSGHRETEKDLERENLENKETCKI